MKKLKAWMAEHKKFSVIALLWSSFFVTLRAKKILL